MKTKFQNFVRCLSVSMPMVAAWFAVASGFASAAEPPILKSGKIDSTVIHIGPRPRASKLTLDLYGLTNFVVFSWAGPAGLSLRDGFPVIDRSGQSVFDASGIGPTFSPYAAAGNWTLTMVELCFNRNCSVYSGDALSALFPSLNLTVVNPNTDTKPPTVSSAVVMTPAVVGSPYYFDVEVGMTMQDDVSGVTSATVAFSNGADGFTVGGDLSHLINAPATYRLIGSVYSSPAGTYTASQITLKDAAGNITTITDAPTISTLFGGQPTITVTN